MESTTNPEPNMRGYEEETKSLVGNSSNGTAGHQRRDSFVSQVPSWIEVQELHWKERAEIQLYKLVSLIPVSVTFCLYTYLFVYYSYFFLYPTITGNYSKISFDKVWESDETIIEATRNKSLWCAGFFAFFSFNLLVAIVRTIGTNPGNIPDHKEWDMSTDASEADSGSENQSLRHRQEDQQSNPLNSKFSNSMIERHMKDPKEIVHEDYKYLQTREGPLVQSSGSRSNQPSLRSRQYSNVRLQMSVEKKKFGGVRICQWCYKAKPDRCHHCSQCNRCILKMDHHCPWVANCIGFYNYKFFLSMLFHCATTNWLIVLTSYPVLKRTVSNPQSFNYKFAYFIMTSYILSSVLALIITAFFTFHLYLICNQYTTIEFCEKRSEDDNTFHTRKPYNRGFCQNFRTILGYNPFFWFVPFLPNYDGDGIMFQLNKELEKQRGALAQ